jgi:hypothetical protein
MRNWPATWGRNALISGVASALLSGCGGSDLSGYRPLEKNGSTPVLNSTKSDQAPVADTVSADANPATDSDLLPVEEVPVSALGPVNVVDGTSVSTLLKVTPDKPADSSSEAVAPVQPASAVAAKPRSVELLIPEKNFQRDAASKALRVSYDDLDLLKVLNLDPVTENAVDLMPAWLKGLNGQRIRIRGFMYPTFEAEGIETFVLARDNQICCFGRDPKVYDLVQVDMRNGKTTDYIPATRAFDVIGKFKIEMISEDGKPYGLYHIEDAEIIDR